MPGFFCPEFWAAQQARLSRAEADEYEPNRAHTPKPVPTRKLKQLTQTFPNRFQTQVSRQTENDLTCGLRAVQNLYGQTFATKDEMDQEARLLETKSHGIAMHHAQLGFYSQEVLVNVLRNKGKHVQLIDLQKIPSEYFLEANSRSHAFAGYIVTLGLEDVKHYVAIKYNAGRYRKLDSMPGKRPMDIEANSLFRMRSDNHVYCSTDEEDTDPVVSILAVGASSFVEYRLLHGTWTGDPPDIEDYMGAIHTVITGPSQLQTFERQLQADVRAWYNNKSEEPSDKVLGVLATLLNTMLLQKTSVLLSLYQPGEQNNLQTVLQCTTMEQMLGELHALGWITTDHFRLTTSDNTPIVDAHGDEIHMRSEGPLEAFGVVNNTRLNVFVERFASTTASIGGFYTFKTTVDGQCVSKQQNAYSVRDDKGKVHVVYKHVVDSITPKQ